MSDRDIAHGKTLGRVEAIGEAHRGLTTILRERRQLADERGEVWIKARDVFDMLGRIT